MSDKMPFVRLIQEDIRGLDEDALNEVDVILTRMLNKIKEDYPERYERAMKRAEEELDGNNGNGGKGVDPPRRHNKKICHT